MAIKVYISPSNQPANQYACGDTTEQAQCYRIAEAAKNHLERNGFSVMLKPKGTSMSDMVAASNAWGADVHIPIHTNAAGAATAGQANGAVVFVYSKTSGRMKYAQPVYDELHALQIKGSNRGVVENAGLYEVKSAKGITVYCECEFHDNADLAKYIIENVDLYGQAIAKGLCKGCGKAYVPAGGPAPTTFTVSRNLRNTTPMMTGNDVLEVQKALVSAGYKGKMTTPNGKFGPNTRDAVKAFQLSRKLYADGIVGKNTTIALGGIWAG